MADEDEEISYEMLQELVRAERRSNKLMPVPSRFWPKVREFLSQVTAEFRAAQQKDPWSRKAMLLSDEVKNAKHAGENLWALRERKLAMLALARERDRKKPDGITADEGHLYTAILALLDDHRKRVFEGTVSAPGQAPPSAAARPAAQPGSQPGAQPGAQPAARVAAPTGSQAAPPPALQPVGQPASHPGAAPAQPTEGAPTPSLAPSAAKPAASARHDEAAAAAAAAAPDDEQEPDMERDVTDAGPAAHTAPGAEPATPPHDGAGAMPHGEAHGAPAPAAAASEPIPPDMMDAPKPIVVPADSPAEAMMTVRALSDIPQFVGPDMQTYLLQEGDLATLPEGIAKLLVRRKKAALIEDF